MLNKYPGTCGCGTYVNAGKGAYARGAVLCATCAPPGSSEPEPESAPEGMEAVVLSITGTDTACAATVDKLRISPQFEVKRVQQLPVDEPGRAAVSVQAHVYTARGW